MKFLLILLSAHLCSYGESKDAAIKRLTEQARLLTADKAGLAQDKIILTQAGAKLSKQINALLAENEVLRKQAAQVPVLLDRAKQSQRQVDQLQVELKGRPAVVAMPPAAQQTLTQANDKLKVTADKSAANNDLLQQIKIYLAIGLAVVIALSVSGFSVIAWMLLGRINRVAEARNAWLEKTLSGERAAREAFEETLTGLLKAKGVPV